MRTALRATIWSAALSLLLLAAIAASTAIGPVPIEATAVGKALLSAVPVPTALVVSLGRIDLGPVALVYPDGVRIETIRPLQFGLASTTRTIVIDIRLPRILLAAVVGFALSAAGAVMQGFFRNPMADPSIIGVSSGAAVGAVATIALPQLIPVGLRTAAFAGALMTAGAVYFLATENGRTPVATLLLAGVAVQTFLGAVISFLLLHSGESLRRAVYWLMGHLHASTYGDVLFAALAVGLGFPILLAFAPDLNVLLLGEEDAHHLGVEVRRTKGILLALSSLVTAAAVAVAGVIGFVGLIVPHVMRLIVGPDHRVLLPTSALAGATFLVVTDTVARSGPAEMPVGIVTAALGAPFFLFLLRRREVTAL